jgi:DNA-binding SARP family transcriptional activator
MRIDVWGALSVARGGELLTSKDFSGVKPKQFLEILVIERGHTVSKGRLADLLWKEHLPQNHLATLETYASVLRQTLEPGVRARDSIVVTERGGYRLDHTRVTIDLDEFDRTLARVSAAEPTEALRLLQDALELVRGQVLEDEPYADWAEETRNTYRLRHVQALIDAGRLSLLTGDAVGALRYAEDAVAINPLAEAAYQVQMTAAYLTWRQEEALQAFDRCRRLLADELGVDPLDETVALHMAILRHEDVASTMPRLPAMPTGQSRLVPEQPTVARILDREDELGRLEQVARRAASGQFSLVLVVGESGIGKTTLVQELARRLNLPMGYNRCSDLESELPYVALALALRSVLPATDVPGIPILGGLLRDVDESRPYDNLTQIRAMERLAELLAQQPPLLLILDDVQWADAQSITMLGYLRRRCAEAPVTVIVTSSREGLAREALRTLTPDLRIDLDVLPPEALEPLGDPELHHLTGGHPLFVDAWRSARELGLAEDFTPAVRERVVTRAWDYGPQAYRLATIIAVLEPPVSLETLAALVGAPADDLVDELDLLVQRRVLVATGDGYRFRHAPERQILAGTMSPVRQKMLLQRAAADRDGPPRRRSSDRSAPTGGSSDPPERVAQQRPPT